MTTVRVAAFHPEMTKETCQLVLSHIVEHFGDLLPDRLYGETARGPKETKVTAKQLSQLMRAWDEQALDEVHLWNSAETLEVDLDSFEADTPMNWFVVEVADHLCAGSSGGQMLERLDVLARTMIQASPLAVNVCLSSDYVHENRGHDENPIPVLWRNYWSPQLLRWIGEKAVRSADWLRVEELPDGWLCLDAYPTPFDYLQDECVQRRVKITEFLKMGVLNRTVHHAMWSQRPLTKRWPEAMPDTPLLGE